MKAEAEDKVKAKAEKQAKAEAKAEAEAIAAAEAAAEEQAKVRGENWPRCNFDHAINVKFFRSYMSHDISRKLTRRRSS